MSEVIHQGWEEPETIRQTLVWPIEVSRAAAEYAEKQQSTPIEVITQFVREALVDEADLSDNGGGHRAASESNAAVDGDESDEPDTIRQTMVWPIELVRAIADCAEKQHSTPTEVITQSVREALVLEGYLSDNGKSGNNSGRHRAASESSAAAAGDETA